MDLSAPLGFSKINYSFNDLTYTCGNGEGDGENAVVPMTVLKMVAGWLTKHIEYYTFFVMFVLVYFSLSLASNLDC